MTIDDIKKQDLLLFECISGSKAYGLDTPGSDTDIKGVFVLPQDSYYSLNYIPQISNNSHDIVYFELKRYIELLTRNNPNILEMLFVSNEFVLYEHPLWKEIKPELFLSKLCQVTFAGYAMTQIKKARGLKKKILNPIDRRKKSILEFIHVIIGYKSKPLIEWLDETGFNQAQCGLVNVPNMKHIYALFYDKEKKYNFSGIMKSQNSMDVALSRIPKELTEEAIIYVNVDGYSRYCKEYSEYWEWVNKRNEARYKNTISHGKKYDSKNMMHTFRLLDIAEEIALTGKFTTKRPNRQELLKIKSGLYEYDDLLNQANDRLKRINNLFKKSNLPDTVDLSKANSLLIDIRKKYYYLKSN
ncbi:MAG: DNA polymerase beta superfamily protein [bacterium]